MLSLSDLAGTVDIPLQSLHTSQTCLPCHCLPGADWHSYQSFNPITHPKSSLSVWLVKLLPTCHPPCLRNAMIAPILPLHPVFFFFHFSLFSLCQVPTCPTPQSIVHRDCTTLCDFLHSLLYRPHCWRLTIWINFIRSSWPSCLHKTKKCTTLYA